MWTTSQKPHHTDFWIKPNKIRIHALNDSIFTIFVAWFYKNRMKYSELEKRLSKSGCYLVKADGRHPVWYSPITNKFFLTSHHKSEEVKPGTLRSIIRDSGIK